MPTEVLLNAITRACRQLRDGIAPVVVADYLDGVLVDHAVDAELAAMARACDDCGDSGIAGHRPDDGAPLVCTACQGPDGPKRRA